MVIYTRTGDDGTTSIFGGKRLSKANVQVEAYGCLDELTSTLGMFITYIDDTVESHFVEDIQRDLHIIMGFLANAPTDLGKQKSKVLMFEKKIDILTEKLPPLMDFILPGGTLASCWAHMARVSCRKAERAVVFFFEKRKKVEEENSQIIFQYLNRLSDLLFTYSRIFNNLS